MTPACAQPSWIMPHDRAPRGATRGAGPTLGHRALEPPGDAEPDVERSDGPDQGTVHVRVRVTGGPRGVTAGRGMSNTFRFLAVWLAVAVLITGSLTALRVRNASQEDMLLVVAMNCLRAAYVAIDPTIAEHLDRMVRRRGWRHPDLRDGAAS